MNRQIQLALLFTLFSLACAGRVYPWGEPWISNPNKNYVKTIDLYFSLDNPLPNGHVIRVQFPFANVLTFSSVRIFPITTSRGSAPATATPGTALSLSTSPLASSTTPFSYYWATTGALTAATNYVIRFAISSTVSDSPGFLGYIQIDTMSPSNSVTTSLTNADVAIIYDSNLAFAQIHLFDAPVTATFNAASSDANALVASASYVRQFRFSLTRDFFYWPLITFTWDNKDFTITNCVNADIGTGSGVAVPLASTQYSCTQTQVTSLVNGVSTVSGGMWSILHNNQIPKATTIVYNFTIANPQNGGTINVNMQVMHRYNMNLTDISASAQSWTVTVPAATAGTTTNTAVSINNQKILLSWGIDPNVITATQRKIFNIHGTDTTIKSYQALRFVFGTNATLATANYTVTIGICTTLANCDVLENSIVTTLTGTCTATLASPTNLLCTNVNTIAITNNIIAARVWLTSATTTIFDATSPVALVNDTGFGTYRIDLNTATITAGVTTIAVTNVATATSSPPYTGGFPEGATPQTLVNVNGNGPLIGFQDATTYGAYKQMTDFLGATSGMPAGDKPKVLGGVYGHTTGSAASYYIALLTKIDLKLAYAAAAKTVFGVAVVDKASKWSGFDFFMNPNLWGINAAAGTKCIISNTPDQLLRQPAATPNAADITLHCYALANVTTGSTWTRVRTLTLALLDITATP